MKENRLGKRRSTEDILGVDSKYLLSPFKDEEVYEDKSLIWKKFQAVSDQLKPEIKEIINNLTQTVVDASHCFLDLFNLFSRAELIDDVLAEKERVEKMAELTSKACSLFKIELAQLVRQNKEYLRYQSSGTLEEISMISEKMMRHIRSSFRPSYNIFKNEMIDLSLISDPELRFLGLTKNKTNKSNLNKRSQIYIEPAMEEEHMEYRKSHSKQQQHMMKRSEFDPDVNSFTYNSGPQTLKNSLMVNYGQRKKQYNLNKLEKNSRSSPVQKDSSDVRKKNYPSENVFIKPNRGAEKIDLSSGVLSSRSIKNKIPNFSKESSKSPNERKTSDFLKARKSLTPSPKRSMILKIEKENQIQRSKTPKPSNIEKKSEVKSSRIKASKTSRSRYDHTDQLRNSLHSAKFSESGPANLPSQGTNSTRRELFKAQTEAFPKKRYQSRVSQSNISNFSENPNNFRDLSNSSTNRKRSKSLKRKRMSKAFYLKNKLKRFAEELPEQLPLDSSDNSYILKNFFGIYNIFNPTQIEIDCKKYFFLKFFLFFNFLNLFFS